MIGGASMRPAPNRSVEGVLERVIVHQSKNKAYRKRLYLSIKRLIDLTGSVILCILALPIIITITLAMKIYEPRGPVFFKQERVGQYGRKFKIYKFRSMVLNAQEVLKSDEQLYQRYVANGYKLEQDEDPRITRLGKFLRKTSLDELPQLINVIEGKMSLVGPRPVLDEELLHYGMKQKVFLSAKPGLTGYWQVSGRSNVNYPERKDIELYYIYNQSLWMDIKILLKTIFVVINKTGAQ
jgi:exopolysaccharide production protein ExoY